VKAFLTNIVRVYEGHLGFTNILSFIPGLPQTQDGSHSLGHSFPLFLDFFVNCNQIDFGSTRRATENNSQSYKTIVKYFTFLYHENMEFVPMDSFKETH